LKKKLNETAMTNELRGHSLYFQDPAVIEPAPTKAAPPKRKTTKKPKARKRVKPRSVPPQPEAMPKILEILYEVEVIPLDPAPDSHALPANQKLANAQRVEEIRQIVRWLGRDSSFCRFTAAEKNALKTVIEVQRRRGIRTTENEVVRIALNWLLADFREHEQKRGKKSVLAQVLAALNA